MKLLKNKMFIEIIISVIALIIRIGISALIVIALIKYIFG